MVAALATGIIAGNSQTVFATSDNLMDAILSEDTDNDEITVRKQRKILLRIPVIVCFVEQI